MDVSLSIEENLGVARVSVFGSWRLPELEEVVACLAQASPPPKGRLVLDGSALAEIDTSGATLLLRFLAASGGALAELEFEEFLPEHESILSLVCERLDSPAEIRPRPALSLIEKVGCSTIAVFCAVRAILSFVGQLLAEIVFSLFHPRMLRLKEFAVQLENAGVDAVPIVSLVTFLIGIVLAYLFGIQMEKYGANIFIVDAVALAMCREISPILVAIIVAGRSGSAFTAQIGTMKLNEEIDAMVSLGLSPMRVLVLPRVFALMLAMPILTFVGDVVGITGGMLIADLQLNITGMTFITRLQSVLKVRSLLVGLLKAPVFAFFVAAIGCRMGLHVENNARSIGLSTTSTVVKSIVAVILLNAAFAVIFSKLGI